jgi:hypothetical protein
MVYIADPLHNTSMFQKVYDQEPLRKTQKFWFDGGSYVNESPLETFDEGVLEIGPIVPNQTQSLCES